MIMAGHCWLAIIFNLASMDPLLDIIKLVKALRAELPHKNDWKLNTEYNSDENKIENLKMKNLLV